VIEMKMRGPVLAACLIVMLYCLGRDIAVFAQNDYHYVPSTEVLADRIDTHIANSEREIRDLQDYRFSSNQRITSLENLAESDTWLLRMIGAGIFSSLGLQFAGWFKKQKRGRGEDRYE
jgi:hypothetical protein